MPDTFDRLLRDNYYQGMRRFSPPLAPPFAPPPPINASITPESPTTTQQPPDIQPAPEEAAQEPEDFISGAYLRRAIEELQPDAAKVEEQKSIAEDRLQAKLGRLYNPKEAEPSFWQKFAIKPVISALTWVEKIDATSYGLIRGTVAAALHGKTLWDELGIQPGDSLWKGAEEYTRRLGTPERLIGELLFSPFNLLPVVGFGGIIARKLGLPTAAKGLAMITSKLAREQALLSGVMYKFAPIRLMQNARRTQVQMVISDELGRVLSTPDIVGRIAESADDVVVRVRALMDEDYNTLGTMFHNPEKVMGTDYKAKELRAYYKATTRQMGFDSIIAEPEKYIGMPKHVVDASGKTVTNPELLNIMNNFEGFMKNPGNYTDASRVPELRKVMDTTEFPWEDFRVSVGGQDRDPAEVLATIFGLMDQSAVPLTVRSAKGTWNATHPLATFGNALYNLNRSLLRQGLTHLYLLTRPAYTAYNRMTDFVMLSLQHPLQTLQFYADPASKIRLYSKEIFGFVDQPEYFKQAYGTSYIFGREAVDEQARLAGKTLPLLGEGKYAKRIKEVVKEYHEVPKTQRPWIERAPFVGPLMHEAAAWTRGINLAGEVNARSGVFAFEHYKVFNKMQRSMAKELGMKEDWLLNLTQFPEQLGNLVKGKSIPAEHLIPWDLLDPYTRSLIDKGLSALPKEYDVLDVVQVIKQAKKIAPKDYDDMVIYYALRHPPEGTVSALDKIAFKDAENAMRMAGYSEEEISKNLDTLLQAATPQQRKFAEHIRARKWVEKKQQYMNEFSSPTQNVALEQELAIDRVFVDKLRIVAHEHHARAVLKIDAAKASGTEVFSSDIAGIYAEMSRKEIELYDVWEKEINRYWEGVIEKSRASAEGVPLEAVDSPVLLGDDKVNEILKLHGMEDMLNLKEVDVIDMIGKARKESMKILDQTEIGVLRNFEKMNKFGKTPSLDVSRIKFSLTSQGITGDMPTAIRDRISSWLEKLPIRVKTNLKEITINPSKFKGPKALKPNAVFDPNIQAIILRDSTVVRDEGTFFHELSHAYSNYIWETQGTGLHQELAKVLDPTIIGKLKEAGDYYEFYKTGGKLFEENIAETMSAWFSGGSEGVEKWVIGRSGKKGYADKLSDIYTKYFPKREIPGSEWITQADLVRVRNTALAYAKREGDRQAKNSLFNYGVRMNVDWLMNTVMPYPYWQTRFILHWAARAIDNPSQLNALVVLMKEWSSQTKDLPAFLMASPITLDLPDGSQIRFSPSQYFFPLSYQGLEILRYGDQINDTIDAVSAVKDFVGGYLYPTVDLTMGLMAYAFDIPGYKSKGLGTVKDPREILKDLVPQLKLLRGTLGYNSTAVKFALEKGMFTDGEIGLAIRAIGDDLNSGTLKDVRQAQLAIEALQNRRPHPIAIKYLSKVLKRKLWTDSARYSGAPVAKWYPEQQKTNYIQKLLYPKEGEPPAPDVQKAILAAYPGLEVIRGATVPAGLNRNQERQWEAARTYYISVDDARKGYLENSMKRLVNDFDNPKEGATITPNEFIARRKELYNKYRGAVEIARRQADKNNAPIESDDRELFWRDVGRPVWPKHPLGILLNQYYDIEAANFPGTTALETDWQGFFKAKEDFLLRLVPWERKWLEDYLNDPSRADAGFRQAQETVRPYWSIRESMIANDPELETLLRQIEYYSRVDPDIAKIYERHPKVVAFKRLLKRTRISLREENSALNMALQKYWGYKPLS